MSNEQANNKLPEKTLQQIAEKFIHEQIGLRVDAPDDTPMDKRGCVYCLVKLTEFYDEVVSQKESLIETTHANLLAALEENNRLKLVLRNALANATGRVSVTDQRWIEFCKNNNIQP